MTPRPLADPRVPHRRLRRGTGCSTDRFAAAGSMLPSASAAATATEVGRWARRQRMVPHRRRREHIVPAETAEMADDLPALCFAVDERWASAISSLHPGARAGELYRFCCRAKLADTPFHTRHFEAVAAEPVAAVEQVVAKVEAWRTAERTAADCKMMAERTSLLVFRTASGRIVRRPYEWIAWSTASSELCRATAGNCGSVCIRRMLGPIAFSRRHGRCRGDRFGTGDCRGRPGADARRSRLEAVLFLAREPLSLRKLAQLANLADGTEARTLLARLRDAVRRARLCVSSGPGGRGVSIAEPARICRRGCVRMAAREREIRLSPPLWRPWRWWPIGNQCCGPRWRRFGAWPAARFFAS